MPGASVDGFTCTESVAGRVPVSGVAMSHASMAGVVTTYAGVPDVMRRDTLCAAGSFAPCCHENVSDAAEPVMVGAWAVRSAANSRAAASAANEMRRFMDAYRLSGPRHFTTGQPHFMKRRPASVAFFFVWFAAAAPGSKTGPETGDT